MRVLVTGSAGHLGEALVRTLRGVADRGTNASATADAGSHEPVGVDILPSPFTTHVGSVTDAPFMHEVAKNVDLIIHAATLHKPHVATHSRQDFIDTNITGTLNVLEAALANGVGGVVFTSTTSAFGAALRPGPGQPAAWITEDVVPVPRNIYSVTKTAAEDLCELFHRTRQLPCIVLRTSRFFLEDDDSEVLRQRYDALNLKVIELLYRRVDLLDVVEAHMLAATRLREIGFAKYIISGTSPFTREHLQRLRTDAPRVVRKLYPESEEIFAQRGWEMLADIERVYVNARARNALGWQPRYDFAAALTALRQGRDVFSPLARVVGAKGYHEQVFAEGPYPVDRE